MKPSSAPQAPRTAARIPAKEVDAALAKDHPLQNRTWAEQWSLWMRQAPNGLDNGLPW